MVLAAMGVVLVIIGIVFAVNKNTDLMALFVALGVFLCFVVMFCPISGYENPILKEEHELLRLIPEEHIYVIETRDGAYKYAINEKQDSQESVPVMYTNSMVEVVILDKGLKPFIRKYVSRPKKSLFTFAMLPEKEEYRIFINENHIMKE